MSLSQSRAQALSDIRQPPFHPSRSAPHLNVRSHAQVHTRARARSHIGARARALSAAINFILIKRQHRTGRYRHSSRCRKFFRLLSIGDASAAPSITLLSDGNNGNGRSLAFPATLFRPYIFHETIVLRRAHVIGPLTDTAFPLKTNKKK